MDAKTFLNKVPDNNTTWAAQQMYDHFNGKGELGTLIRFFDKLDTALYKSWAKEMTFSELHEAITFLKNLEV